MVIAGDPNRPRLSLFNDNLRKYFPKSTHILLTKCPSVLKPLTATNTTPTTNVYNTRLGSTTTSLQGFSCFLASLPGTSCGSFYYPNVSQMSDVDLSDATLRLRGLTNVEEVIIQLILHFLYMYISLYCIIYVIYGVRIGRYS